MNRTLFAAPRLLTYGFVVIALLAAWGWVKPFLDGPDLRFSTITSRTRPVPVKVTEVKWLTKVETQIKRERVEVPVVVIREVPAKVEERLKEDFGIKLPDLRDEGRELVDVLDVPKAPNGGEMALTIHTTSGKIDGTFRARPAPFIEFGGLREAGVDLDMINTAVVGYYRQDLARVGPAVVNGKVFAAVPVAGGEAGQANAGASIGVAIRF